MKHMLKEKNPDVLTNDFTYMRLGFFSVLKTAKKQIVLKAEHYS